MIENESVLPVPAPRVWEVLLAFDRYVEWHPFIRLRGEAVLGAEIDYIYTTTWISRRTAKAFARIVELEPMRLVGVRIGIRQLFTVTERFVLEAHGGGTKLWHGLEYRGLVARLTGGMSRRTAPMMREVDVALRDYLVNRRRGRERAPRRLPRGASDARDRQPGHSEAMKRQGDCHAD